MNSNKVGARALLLALFLGVIVITIDVAAAAAGVSTPEHGSESTDSIAWAENVRDNRLGEGVGANFSDPSAALGEDDAVPGVSGIYSLGNALNSDPEPPLLPSQCEAYLIVDFGENFIFDGEGTDIGVFEVAANGVAEATWVYVGRDEGESELWLYAGQTGGSIDGVDIAGVGDPDELFNLVALCDYPDGISSGSPVGGPDIDAIAGLYFRRTGLAAEATGPGWSKNEEALPAGENTAIEEGDSLAFDCPGGSDPCTDSDLNVNVECFDREAVFVMVLRSVESAGEVVSTLSVLQELLPGFEELCLENNALVLGQQDPMAIFSIEEGTLDFSVEDDIWRFRVESAVAHVTSAGTNDFWVRYDAQDNEARIRVAAGVVTIDPSAPGEDPFDLQAGQQVTIGADGAGAVIDLAFSYLPLTRR